MKEDNNNDQRRKRRRNKDDVDHEEKNGPEDDNDDVDGFLSDSSSSVTSVEERQRNRDKKHKKRKKHDKKRKKEKKKKKSKKHKKKRRRHGDDDDDDDDDEDTDDGSSDSYSEEDRRDRRKRRRRKERKKSCRDSDGDDAAADGSLVSTPIPPAVAALHTLLHTKPGFASELPIILIRLAGGTTFDLRQVTDPCIAKGLKTLFADLEPFGVQRDDTTGMWMFRPPPGAGRRDELVLLRVIRSLLDDAGLTMTDIVQYESQERTEPQQQQPEENTLKPPATKSAEQPIKQQTFQLLSKYQSQDSELAPQLMELCRMIAEGESVSLDGLPDENLKDALESLFDACGLEKSEMENDEDSSDEDKQEGNEDSPLMGYGLPEHVDDNIQVQLATIMAACREGPPKRRPVGPVRQPMTEQEEREVNALYATKSSAEKTDDDGEEEDDGPLLPGEARKGHGPTLPPDVIRAQAEYRELQLKATVAGVDMPIQGGREEWMVVPGKYDFLSNIKSGQPMKSRGFQNKKSRDDEKAAAPIHPAIQAEMDAIMQAHQNARGQSLMDQHRAMKQKEKDAAAASSGRSDEWKWNRDKDLDAGRRVDKDALGMILGGAADNLKTKFHGGFNR
ncbi:DUF3752 domain containing protein [Nitzschia inconspicua]|uniref:DUF3752 domain containing protein n=1 Tax=Nitzschia inconspicua TaxID=303405 RepID=A0A9K3K6W5_9STRA|nr:DUF3752 domain containing protein [Nitzschia inconspicua]KAG7360798.1 DUF3752 domain containing protein [Nitzschia inconspicua]